MTTRSKTVAVALAGAVAAASGAYAVGSQQGGGGATAAPGRWAYGPPPPGAPPGGWGHRPPPGAFHPGLAPLAKKLGVPEAKLRAALEKLHRQQEAAFPGELAGALGIPRSRVEAALKSLPRPPGPPPGHHRGPW
jgi:hypothetical protein